MRVCVFDTETISVDKPFCYNIGYVIVDTSNGQVLTSNDFVVEQVWSNTMLFNTAYYAEKKPLYVKRMRARLTKMDKFGYICQRMIRDFRAYEVESAYAYNSAFDERVFAFNCDWFKTSNPFDNVPVFDIRGYAHEFLCDRSFCEWAERHNEFTESGNYSTTAETLGRYITSNPELIEEHTALSDSLLEMQILFAACAVGAQIGNNYKAKRSLVRETSKQFTVKRDGQCVFSATCATIRYNKTKNEVVLR